MSVKRKRYSPAEKARIALDAIKGELTMAQISSKYSVKATQVSTWKKQAMAFLPDAFTDKGKEEVVAYETLLADLYEQIGRLKVENDFLKKKFELFHG
jgi:transposase